MAWNDAMNDEARKMCQQARDHIQQLPLVDEGGYLTPSPAYAPLDLKEVDKRCNHPRPS